MKMINIVNKTLDLLNANDEWNKRYADYLSDIWVNSCKSKKGFHKPVGLSVYTTLGTRNEKKYYLRFKGQNVGEVFVGKADKTSLRSLVKESKRHDIKDCPILEGDEPVEWDSSKATEFRKFFSDLPLNTRTKSNEHYVENMLLKEFRKRHRDEKALPNIQPVLLHGNFFQMPTPLKASSHKPEYAKQKGGGIDIMARMITKSGRRRLCVIEVKDENKESESQEAAMSQAVTYATFIACLLEQNPDFMEFFMGHAFKHDNLPSTLDKYDIEVITIMPAGDSTEFVNEVVEIPGTQFKLHCHSLYYDKSKFDKSNLFDFTGTLLEEIKQ
ncbi:MAG: hypothetical protein HDT07_01770 [Bacteroidales bacterium]|nr:hypothetical protein [Bacteroidales bacterium]